MNIKHIDVFLKKIEEELDWLRKSRIEAEKFMRGIINLPETGWAGDEPREACMEARRMAINALYALGFQSEDEDKVFEKQRKIDNDPCDKIDKDEGKVYFEIRMAAYSKDCRKTREFGNKIWNGKVPGRCEMCAGVPHIGDYREYGHESIRIPVKKAFFNKVWEMLETEFKDAKIDCM